jgi:hypothetical protein
MVAHTAIPKLGRLMEEIKRSRQAWARVRPCLKKQRKGNGSCVHANTVKRDVNVGA